MTYLDPMDQPEQHDLESVVVHASDLIGPIALYIHADVARELDVELPDGQPEIRPVPDAFGLSAGEDRDGPDGTPASTYYSADGELIGWVHMPDGVFADPPDGTPAVMEHVEVYGETMVRYMHAQDGHPADVDGPAESYVDADGKLVWTCDVEQHWTYHR